MSNDEIKKLLLVKFPDYASKNALLEDLTLRISSLPEKEYREPLIKWLNGGEVPDLSCSGYSVKYLVDSRKFTVPSAVLSIAWLEFKPEAALQAFQYIGLPPENKK